MKSIKTLLVVLAVGIVLFLTSGYLLSDSYFFRKLIRQNQIKTPEQAFEYVVSNTDPASISMGLTLLTSPRNMLTRQKHLFCDQSAVVMATMVQQLGYRTRLVDFVGDDGIRHHTILEVLQGDKWKTYDTLLSLQNATYQQSARASGPEYYTHRVEPIYRTYPRFHNLVIQNNFYIQYLAFRLKGSAD